MLFGRYQSQLDGHTNFFRQKRKKNLSQLMQLTLVVQRIIYATCSCSSIEAFQLTIIISVELIAVDRYFSLFE